MHNDNGKPHTLVTHMCRNISDLGDVTAKHNNLHLGQIYTSLKAKKIYAILKVIFYLTVIPVNYRTVNTSAN